MKGGATCEAVQQWVVSACVTGAQSNLSSCLRVRTCSDACGWWCAACQSRLLREKKERQLEEWEEVVATHRWAHVRGVEEIRRRFEEMSEQDKARAQGEAEEERRREEQRRLEGGAGGVYRRIGDAQDTFVVDVPITEVGRAHHHASCTL